MFITSHPSTNQPTSYYTDYRRTIILNLLYNINKYRYPHLRGKRTFGLQQNRLRHQCDQLTISLVDFIPFEGERKKMHNMLLVLLMVVSWNMNCVIQLYNADRYTTGIIR